MITLITIVHVLVCFFMVLVILLQAGRGGGLSGLAGGSSSAFGGRGSQTFLGKITTVCAAIFMLTSLSLAFFSVEEESIIPRDLQAPGVLAPANGEENQNGSDLDIQLPGDDQGVEPGLGAGEGEEPSPEGGDQE